MVIVIITTTVIINENLSEKTKKQSREFTIPASYIKQITSLELK